MERLAQDKDLREHLLVPSTAIEETLGILRRAGSLQREGIVLWFSSKQNDENQVVLVLEPLHKASEDMFHIPRAGVDEILALCREESLRLVAQVHSHPFEAFHSDADNRWAILRHAGAISIVIPHFAVGVTAETFLEQAATYVLTQADDWVRIQGNLMRAALEVTK